MPQPDFVPEDTPLKKLIELRRERYNSVHNVYCPFLKEVVYFNNKGFHHATHDGRGHMRGEADARMRLNLLTCVTEVIERSTEFAKPPEVMAKNDDRNAHNTGIIFYELYCRLSKNKEVIVVLRKIGNGRLHYYSVRYVH